MIINLKEARENKNLKFENKKGRVNSTWIFLSY